ncbi:PAS domain-containing sensor histidine kinase [Aeoliella mucimassa]|uniref:histidine kinase n=1 Tax=Aeoliella mucimassa TaxID=2527972 RepID=A0A518ANC6_9BACT|nr:PAS domain S-box protein [Aeoliella mucimassa]QDU56228.1 Sensor protein ZraS [Aeoliella mucimassa]
MEYVNPHFTRTTGYSAQEALGNTSRLLKSGETPDSVYEDLWSKINSGQNWSGELLNRKRSGELYWEQQTIAPLVNELGKITHFIAVKEDITCRKISEKEQLRLAEELKSRNDELAYERRMLQTIVDSAPLAIFWKDRESVYLGCNALFARMAGVESSDEIKGLTDFEMPWTTDEALHYRLCDQQVMELGFEILNHEETHTSSDGKEHIVWTSKAPFYDQDGNVVGMVGVYSDVTEQREAAVHRDQLLQETQEQKSLLDAVMSSVGDGILAFDDSKHLLCSNPAAEKILGVTMEVGNTLESCVSTLQICHLDGETPVETSELAVNKAIAGNVVVNEEVLLRSKSGDKMLSVNAAPLVANGHRGGVVTMRDVTEYKTLERQLLQSQKLESIGQLAAGIAHEINTPMQFVADNIEFLEKSAGGLCTVIDRYNELLTEETPKSWSQRKQEIEEMIETCDFNLVRSQFAEAIDESREGIQRTVNIIKAMKSFSHPGNKDRVMVNINEAIRSTMTISRNRWKYNAEIDLNLDDSLPEIPAYPSELNQVLLNLIVNASDAIVDRYGENGVGKIEVRSSLTEDGVEVSVKDNGCGIPEPIRQKVFDPFFTTKAVGQGTGQGLSITHNVIVAMHGGQVHLESTEGEGTTFTVCLPIEPDDEAGNDRASFAHELSVATADLAEC